MTSHTPQPPAGDDLVARLRDRAEKMAELLEGRDFDSAVMTVDAEVIFDACCDQDEAAERIEALTSQLTQHTEPVAGEVEVAWTGSGSLAALAQGHEGFVWPTKGDAHPIALVTKSSYDALAAAKDREIERLTEDLQYVRELADSDRDEWAALLNAAVADYNAMKRGRDEAVEYASTSTSAKLESANGVLLRQRDALREALTPSADTKAAYEGQFFMGVTLRTRWEEETRRVQVPWDTIKEIMAAIRDRALKDEGSAT